MSAIRIVVLGDHRVGKSAVTVRFLTRRFIGEYSSDIDLLYRSSIKQEDQLVDVEVLDSCTRTGHDVCVDESRVGWADAFVVVYSILSRSSFSAAKSLIQAVNRLRPSAYVPIMLLANMTDLDHRREVMAAEGHQLAVEMGCQYFEVSAAEDVIGVTLAFRAFLREARLVQQQKSALLKRRRSSLATVSRRLGAMFGKKDSANGGFSGNGGAFSNGASVAGAAGTHTDVNGNRRSSLDPRDLRKHDHSTL
ncbi:ras-related and estrogen-regulated growth inhibitor-like protein [Plakobranchus ocellatus]|uniref:small monomeric GTPase n=1 Tax=Plakobranchus ocellatus TaxID=259542 RepID=A0AAV3Z5V8_9GAST|nr:ras-related and estrogen-regulated growth inhibitor-like protein [Plakobranchus ocellatus]